MKITVPQYLEDTYQIKILPGKKSECPECHHKTLSLKRDKSIAKCFHPKCGKFWTIAGINKDTTSISSILEKFYQECHENLLSKESSTYKYLQEKRLIHPEVIKDSKIGSIPPYSKISEYFQDVHYQIEEKIDPHKKRNET